jgi:serine/threonine-protein kinase RIO1
MNRQIISEEQLHNVVAKAYPYSEVLDTHKHKNYHSTTYRLTIFDNKVNEKKEILLKKYHSKPYAQTLNEYTNQALFYSANIESDCTAPKPISVDAETSSILMEYIRGTSFRSMLLDNPTHLQTTEIMDRCADMLYSYHNTFAVQGNSVCSINCPILGRIPQKKVASIYETYDGINLKMIVRPFLDFSPWNILFSNGRSYLIDFPESNCVCTPHIDIARFIFCMNIVKNTPNIFRLKLKQDWNLHNVCNRFMMQYSKRQETRLNDDDLMLIEFFYKEHARTLMGILKNSSSLIEKIQYFYLKSSIYNGISEGSLDEKMVDLDSRLSETKRRGSEQ